MHAALSILQQIETLLKAAGGPDAEIYREYKPPISTLPAMVIRMGSDEVPGDFGADNVGFLDSVLEVRVSTLVGTREGTDVDAALLALRADTHRAILAQGHNLGLAHVHQVIFSGATPPTDNVEGEESYTHFDQLFRVQYRTDMGDPDV